MKHTFETMCKQIHQSFITNKQFATAKPTSRTSENPVASYSSKLFNSCSEEELVNEHDTDGVSFLTF